MRLLLHFRFIYFLVYINIIIIEIAPFFFSCRCCHSVFVLFAGNDKRSTVCVQKIDDGRRDRLAMNNAHLNWRSYIP